jgi:hypothetical protein
MLAMCTARGAMSISRGSPYEDSTCVAVLRSRSRCSVCQVESTIAKPLLFYLRALLLALGKYRIVDRPADMERER